MKNISLKLLICALLFAGPLPSRSQSTSPVFPILYGYISDAKLADFGTRQLDKPCQALLKHQFAVAAVGFNSIIVRDKKHTGQDSLVAYIGLLQAKPDIWPSEERRLQSGVKHNDPIAQFKLGSLLFYKWGQQHSSQDTTRLAKAQSLIDSAWKKTKLPIVGMMLFNVAPFGTSYTSKHPFGLNVIEDLIKQLAGPKSYKAYLESARGDDKAEPAPVNLIPSANLRALRGVIQCRIQQSQIQGGTSVLKGNNVVFTPNPLSEDQKREYKFMTAWNMAIDKRLQAS